MSIVNIRPLALQDIFESTQYLEENGGFDLAERFLNALKLEFDSLSKMPEVGSLCGFVSSDARNIRHWPVAGFERWLIFYIPSASVIDVLRVLHGARDINALLD